MFKGDVAPLDENYAFADNEASPFTYKEHYNKFILPHVKTYEAKRLEALAAFRKHVFIAIPVLIFLGPIALIFSLMYSLVAFLSFIAAIIFVVWVFAPVIAYKRQVKGNVYPDIFRYFGDDFEFQQIPSIKMKDLKNSGIIPYHRNALVEDYVKGSYKGVSLAFFEARLTKEKGSSSSKSGSRTITVFDGFFVSLKMNKTFKGRTVLKRDQGAILNWLSDKTDQRNLEAVNLEDPVFEKEFEVYSTDQVEARYLLTTSFMQRLLDLSDLFGKAKIECSLYDDIILLKVPTRQNKFETSSIFKPATFEEDIHMILDEMAILFSMIDTLKLYEQTRL